MSEGAIEIGEAEEVVSLHSSIFALIIYSIISIAISITSDCWSVEYGDSYPSCQSPVLPLRQLPVSLY